MSRSGGITATARASATMLPLGVPRAAKNSGWPPSRRNSGPTTAKPQSAATSAVRWSHSPRRTARTVARATIKKLGRFQRPGKRVTGHQRGRASKSTAAGRGRGVVGWDFVHVCVDDATRLAYVEVLADERGATAAAFLGRAVDWFADRGVQVERVMSDNGSRYVSREHARACAALGLLHLRTRPYRPRTNGKAERFIQTLQNDWAYGRAYSSSAERRNQLPSWLNHYNYRRPHGSLSHRPPAARLAELQRTT
jgi:transposase InsO family protein